MSCVKNVSISPTREIARAVGNTSPKVSKLKGTLPSDNEPNGNEILGSPSGSFPRSLTVGISRFRPIETIVRTIIAISWEGIKRVILGKP